ncbi:hypothetical protein EXN66_Car008742 [Channa argus]|uniref:Uncharacterized protein n=1 Tax=Channa argus TaxID=215402 RepID=A0A6G1PSV1_CHAAH|nr:hypothetical protein EXN66_Car008742 [Channa argus]
MMAECCLVVSGPGLFYLSTTSYCIYMCSQLTLTTTITSLAKILVLLRTLFSSLLPIAPLLLPSVGNVHPVAGVSWYGDCLPS